MDIVPMAPKALLARNLNIGKPALPYLTRESQLSPNSKGKATLDELHSFLKA
jgi:hypothetical protein